MEPTGAVHCLISEDDAGRPVGAACGKFHDDDVVGHTFVPTRTATISMSWSEDPNGQRRVQFESDDPEAQALLLDLLNRTNGDSSDQAGAVS